LITYPITVRRNAYLGPNAGKRRMAIDENAKAATLEEFVNTLLKDQEQPLQQYSYQRIADGTQVPLADVRRLCFSIDGGQDGFTAYKTGMTLEQALNAPRAVSAD
jgi:hypothetical protein